MRRLAAFVLPLAALAALVAAPGLVRETVGEALGGLRHADAGALWLAGGAFALGLAGVACAWRAGVEACGGACGRGDAFARYVAGSLANTFLPAGLGSAVRIGLFSRVLPGRDPDRLLTSASVGGTIDAARSIALAPLVVVAAASGVLPRWTLLALAGLAAGAAAVGVVALRWMPAARVARLMDAFRALAARPRAALAVLGWTSGYVGMRVCAAALAAAAVGVESAWAMALVAVPAVGLASVVRVTPGNVGVVSGAFALALVSQGVAPGAALAAGIAFHAVETATSVVAGSVGVAALARLPVPAWSVRVAGAGAAIALAGAFGWTLLA